MEGLVTYVLLPAWIVPGVLDWYWHRRTRIEETAGARESAMHLLMQAEAGVTVMAFLFLEADAGVILAGLLGAALHQATVMWDVAYTTPRRKIAPAEQHTHSFLEALPVMTAAALACMRPEPDARAVRRRPRAPALRVPAAAQAAPGVLRHVVPARHRRVRAPAARRGVRPLLEGRADAGPAPRPAAPAHDRRAAVDPRARRGRLGSLSSPPDQLRGG